MAMRSNLLSLTAADIHKLRFHFPPFHVSLQKFHAYIGHLLLTHMYAYAASCGHCVE